MELFRRVLSAVLLFLLLATGMGPGLMGAPYCKGRSCELQRRCFSNSDCAYRCRTEGFPYGYCIKFGRCCTCTRNCELNQ